jgi:DNA-binding NarL/FixJ family response regulator
MDPMGLKVPARILIVDDHDLVRQAIRQLVETCRDFQVIGEARNGLNAVELARRLHPHIVLMDFHMPVMDGGEATKTIRRELPDVNVIGLSVHPHTEALMRDAGACAHVQKSDLMTDLYPAIFTAIETHGV